MAGRIEDYGLIGDLQTAALVDRTGSIDWLCLPRFDSPACFAALLGDERAGRWLLAPRGAGACTRRRYRGESLVLETEWETPEGAVRVVDLMPPRGEAPDVVRVVEGVSGRVPLHTELVLRFDYGHVPPWTRTVDGDLAGVAGPDAVWLRSDVPLDRPTAWCARSSRSPPARRWPSCSPTRPRTCPGRGRRTRAGRSRTPSRPGRTGSATATTPAAGPTPSAARCSPSRR
ncbi:trehalase-like domain-containing protein [Geodermatophilus sp. URMC 65]